ncbi:hypothetical protein Tco_0866034 [Tanacetum coccineum]
MENKNPICTLRDYSKPSHEGYRNTIEIPDGNNVVLCDPTSSERRESAALDVDNRNDALPLFQFFPFAIKASKLLEGCPDCYLLDSGTTILQGLWGMVTISWEMLLSQEYTTANVDGLGHNLHRIATNISYACTSLAEDGIVERRKPNSYCISCSVSQQPVFPNQRDDWDHLFQPMFDEYFNPPSIVVSPVQEVAAPKAVNLADSLMSTSINQDASSTSIPSTQEQEHSLNIS